MQFRANRFRDPDGLLRQQRFCGGGPLDIVPINSRTTTLVSTTVMTSDYFVLSGGAHLSHCFRLALGRQTAGDLLDIRFWKGAGGPQERPAGMFLGRMIWGFHL
jgi:hypothetical protein